MDKEENKNVLQNNEEKKKGENGMSCKHSEALIASLDANNEDYDDGDDEEEDDKDAIDLGPVLGLKEQLEKDKDDESLRRWKEKLLANVDLSEIGENPDPEVKVLSLTIVTPDRADMTLPIPFEAGSNAYAPAFVLKQGTKYCLKFKIIVGNNIVSGLQYTNTVWKKNIRRNTLDYKKVMLGTFSPQKEAYVVKLQEETTPSGFLAHGRYFATIKFVDDDGKCYLETDYNFDIRKEWPQLPRWQKLVRQSQRPFISENNEGY